MTERTSLTHCQFSVAFYLYFSTRYNCLVPTEYVWWKCIARVVLWWYFTHWWQLYKGICWGFRMRWNIDRIGWHSTSPAAALPLAVLLNHMLGCVCDRVCLFVFVLPISLKINWLVNFTLNINQIIHTHFTCHDVQKSHLWSELVCFSAGILITHTCTQIQNTSSTLVGWNSQSQRNICTPPPA